MQRALVVLALVAASLTLAPAATAVDEDALCAFALETLWDDIGGDPPAGADSVTVRASALDGGSLAAKLGAAAGTNGGWRVLTVAAQGSYFGVRSQGSTIQMQAWIEAGEVRRVYDSGGGQAGYESVSVGVDGSSVDGPSWRDVANLLIPGGGSASGSASYGSGIPDGERLYASDAPLVCLEATVWWTSGGGSLSVFEGPVHALDVEDFDHGAGVRQELVASAGVSLETEVATTNGLLGFFQPGSFATEHGCASPTDPDACDGSYYLLERGPGTWRFWADASVKAQPHGRVLFAAELPPL